MKLVRRLSRKVKSRARRKTTNVNSTADLDEESDEDDNAIECGHCVHCLRNKDDVLEFGVSTRRKCLRQEEVRYATDNYLLLLRSPKMNHIFTLPKDKLDGKSEVDIEPPRMPFVHKEWTPELLHRSMNLRLEALKKERAVAVGTLDAALGERAAEERTRIESGAKLTDLVMSSALHGTRQMITREVFERAFTEKVDAATAVIDKVDDEVETIVSFVHNSLACGPQKIIRCYFWRFEIARRLKERRDALELKSAILMQRIVRGRPPRILLKQLIINKANAEILEGTKEVQRVWRGAVARAVCRRIRHANAETAILAATKVIQKNFRVYIEEVVRHEQARLWQMRRRHLLEMHASVVINGWMRKHLAKRLATLIKVRRGLHPRLRKHCTDFATQRGGPDLSLVKLLAAVDADYRQYERVRKGEEHQATTFLSKVSGRRERHRALLKEGWRQFKSDSVLETAIEKENARRKLHHTEGFGRQRGRGPGGPFAIDLGGPGEYGGGDSIIATVGRSGGGGGGTTGGGTMGGSGGGGALSGRGVEGSGPLSGTPGFGGSPRRRGAKKNLTAGPHEAYSTHSKLLKSIARAGKADPRYYDPRVMERKAASVPTGGEATAGGSGFPSDCIFDDVPGLNAPVKRLLLHAVLRAEKPRGMNFAQWLRAPPSLLKVQELEAANVTANALADDLHGSGYGRVRSLVEMRGASIANARPQVPGPPLINPRIRKALVVVLRQLITELSCLGMRTLSVDMVAALRGATGMGRSQHGVVGTDSVGFTEYDPESTELKAIARGKSRASLSRGKKGAGGTRRGKAKEGGVTLPAVVSARYAEQRKALLHRMTAHIGDDLPSIHRPGTGGHLLAEIAICTDTLKCEPLQHFPHRLAHATNEGIDAALPGKILRERLHSAREELQHAVRKLRCVASLRPGPFGRPTLSAPKCSLSSTPLWFWFVLSLLSPSPPTCVLPHLRLLQRCSADGVNSASQLLMCSAVNMKYCGVSEDIAVMLPDVVDRLIRTRPELFGGGDDAAKATHRRRKERLVPTKKSIRTEMRLERHTRMMQSRTLPSAGAGTLEPSSTMLRKINLRATELDPKYRWPSQHKEEQSTLRRKVYSPAPRPRAGARRPRSVRAVSPGGDDEGKRSHSPRGSPRGTRSLAGAGGSSTKVTVSTALPDVDALLGSFMPKDATWANG